MDNILHYPQSTIVNRVVPKTMFYKFMEVSPRMKTRFVNDVVNITWLGLPDRPLLFYRHQHAAPHRLCPGA